MALSGVVSCIQCRNIWRPWNSGQGSIKVIKNGTIRFDRLGIVSY